MQTEPLPFQCFSENPEGRVITPGGQAIINVTDGTVWSRPKDAPVGAAGYVQIGSVTGGGSFNPASPGPIGNTTASTGDFTVVTATDITSATLQTSSDLSVNGTLTANGDTSLSATTITGALVVSADTTFQGVLTTFSGGNEGDVLTFVSGAWVPQAP